MNNSGADMNKSQQSTIYEEHSLLHRLLSDSNIHQSITKADRSLNANYSCSSQRQRQRSSGSKGNSTFLFELNKQQYCQMKKLQLPRNYSQKSSPGSDLEGPKKMLQKLNSRNSSQNAYLDTMILFQPRKETLKLSGNQPKSIGDEEEIKEEELFFESAQHTKEGKNMQKEFNNKFQITDFSIAEEKGTQTDKQHMNQVESGEQLVTNCDLYQLRKFNKSQLYHVCSILKHQADEQSKSLEDRDWRIQQQEKQMGMQKQLIRDLIQVNVGLYEEVEKCVKQFGSFNESRTDIQSLNFRILKETREKLYAQSQAELKWIADLKDLKEIIVSSGKQKSKEANILLMNLSSKIFDLMEQIDSQTQKNEGLVTQVQSHWDTYFKNAKDLEQTTKFTFNLDSENMSYYSLKNDSLQNEFYQCLEDQILQLKQDISRQNSKIDVKGNEKLMREILSKLNQTIFKEKKLIKDERFQALSDIRIELENELNQIQEEILKSKALSKQAQQFIEQEAKGKLRVITNINKRFALFDPEKIKKIWEASAFKPISKLNTSIDSLKRIKSTSTIQTCRVEVDENNQLEQLVMKLSNQMLSCKNSLKAAKHSGQDLEIIKTIVNSDKYKEYLSIKLSLHTLQKFMKELKDAICKMESFFKATYQLKQQLNQKSVSVESQINLKQYVFEMKRILASIDYAGDIQQLDKMKELTFKKHNFDGEYLLSSILSQRTKSVKVV